MDFGKKTTSESYVRGVLKRTKTTYSVPMLVQDRTQAFNEILKSLELITSNQTTELTLKIEADPKTKRLRMITKEYTVDE